MSNLITFIKDGQLFIIPLLVLIITQILKTILEVKRKRRIKISYFAHYGGMPSSHTALFVSLATITYLNYDWRSPVFAITLIICLIMIRDALGLRYHLGNHGLILKQLIEEQEKNNNLSIKHDKIVTQLGHTGGQVLIGGIIGFSLTVAAYYLLLLI